MAHHICKSGSKFLQRMATAGAAEKRSRHPEELFPVLLFMVAITSGVLWLPNPASAEETAVNFPEFKESNASLFKFLPTDFPNSDQDYARIYSGALQLTPDTNNSHYPKTNTSGRIMLKQPFRLWRHHKNSTEIASFNSSFTLSLDKQAGAGGEGVAFVVSSSIALPNQSHGEYLGLFNSSIDGDFRNQVFAVEFDTHKSGDFDPDSNHVGVNLNSIRSLRTVPLKNFTMLNHTAFHATVVYNGFSRQLSLYVNLGNASLPNSRPVLSMDLDLSLNLSKHVYFGFSGSTGQDNTELNCVKSWSLLVNQVPKSPNRALIIGVLVGSVLGLVVLVLGSWFLLRSLKARRIHQKSLRALDRIMTNVTAGPRKFGYRELKKATHNFDSKCLLGQGGFGSVYKGVLPSKMLIAVKRISENSLQGEQEFLAEVTIISRIRHKNLVRLLGWCSHERLLLLVYEFMPKGSLDQHIFSKNEDNDRVLHWQCRYNIICGVASALQYLHSDSEKQVIHRDIKPSNVMLDENFKARLGDFGLARLVEDNKTSYTASKLAGTPGYMAPEFLHTGRATTQSDVFSFGALVLVVACGRRLLPGSQASNLVDWVWQLHAQKRILEAADPRLSGSFDELEMQCILLLGLACCHPNPNERPPMRVIEQILAKDMGPPVVVDCQPFFMWPLPPFPVLNDSGNDSPSPDSQLSSNTDSSSSNTHESQPL